MQKANCLNCGAALYPKQVYCGTCGQRADTRRYTFRELIHLLVVTITNAEKGIWNLLKGLAIRPGQTASEFVEGKRKRYYNPFAFLAIILTLTVLLNSWFKPYIEHLEVNPEVLKSYADQHSKDVYTEMIRRFNIVNDWSHNYQRIFTLLCAPVYSLILWLFFRKSSKRNMAEIFVSFILFSAFIFLFQTILIDSWQGYFKSSAFVVYVVYFGYLLENFYLAWAYSKFFRFKSISGFFKVLGVIYLIVIPGYFILITLLFLYIYQWDFSNIPKFSNLFF
jgi:hypothetical protein